MVMDRLKNIELDDQDPFRRFAQLYKIVLQSEVQEPSAVILATSTPEGKPSARVVLLKGFDERGFVFYTNLESRKGKEIAQNPNATLCFYWEVIHHQIRVEGKVNQVSDEEADAYFATRDRGSQIGAWASKQSSQLGNQAALLARVAKYQMKFAGRKVTRPDFWSGYRILPERFEFWHRRENRLHERIVYNRDDAEWTVSYLYP